MSKRQYSPVKTIDTLAPIRGMSEPFYFAFNVPKHQRTMVCHAVIFTSFEVPAGSEAQVEICNLERDPRVAKFVDFVWANFLQEKRAEFMKKIEEVDAGYAESKKKLKTIEQQIQGLKKESDEQ